jgi:poly-gamma-glutamate synthesis protein (capsule biosynthesis protein)
MSAYPRCAAVAVLAALAVACGGPHLAPPSPAPRPRGNAGAPVSHVARQRPFTLVASGDISASHPAVLRTAHDDVPDQDAEYDYRPILAGVRPVISAADLALCQLETPLGPLSGPFTAQAPPQLATALKATGFDSCATASEHALDRGVPGVRHTLKVLETVGLRHTGSARSATEGARPALLRTHGARVAQLSYTYGTGGAQRPAAAPWTVNLLDEQKIIADARAARRAGADVVVVSPHWGTEYRTAPNEQQIRLAHALTASQTDGRPDIDLVIGAHAHTPQPYEKVNGTWVVYGLGAQLSGAMRKPQGNWGTIARFRFAPPEEEGERWQVTEAEYFPQLVVQRPKVRVVDLTRTRGHADVRKKIGKAVLSRGAAADGLTMGR